MGCNGVPHHLNGMVQVAFIADCYLHVIADIVIVIITVFHDCLVDHTVWNNHTAVVISTDHRVPDRQVLHNA